MPKKQESTDPLLSFSYQLPAASGYFYLKAKNKVTGD